MTDYKCEETSSSCSKFQSAICLHCQRRLCVEHIIEHSERNSSSDGGDELSNEVKRTLKDIKDKAQQSRAAHNNQLIELNQWREDNLKKINQIYDHELQLINLREHILLSFHHYLLMQLEEGARLPLERLKIQQNLNTGILHHIQQTLGNIQQDMKHLKWNFNQFSNSIKHSQSPSTLLPVQMPTRQDDQIMFIKQQQHQKMPKKRIQPAVPLIVRFSQINSVTENIFAIDAYVRRHSLKLVTIVNAYLTACHEKLSGDEKLAVLNTYVSVVQRYLNERETNADVLIGIQTFFYNNVFEDVEKNGIMLFLLQFFLKYKCIDYHLILNWYNGIERNDYEGFEQAQQLASPFLQSLFTSGS
ncbi:unnamed protein product [Adineta ricciae]|uniref:Uncharacterized protein n=1 Tax=Adineta ricciae TaxID=249248 RepID=A0A813TXL1_ADIRI|nr:unnamed protein product [Adineta ricciae]